MMFEGIDADIEEINYNTFFDKIKRERREWFAQDLVVDRREGWRNWAWRQFNFEDAPLVPREQLPLELQPQTSIRGKVINYINGIDPRLPLNTKATVTSNQMDVDVEEGNQNEEQKVAHGDVELQEINMQ